MINWTQGDLFPTGFDPSSAGWNNFWTVQGDYPHWPISMYATFYIIGILLAVLFCAWRFYKKGVPVTQLALGVIIIIPCALFGGSFFGKLHADGPHENMNGVGFWGLFAFWHPGMAIHGGVYTGVVVGVIVFGIIGHYSKVSLWTYMDLIIPNILIGQAFGRWGNFFNHEVMGAPLADITAGQSALSWLPHYIRVNTQVICSPDVAAGTIVGNINGMDMIAGHVYQMAPLFFYESISFFVGWFLIVFVVPNFGKWIGPKPWKKHADLYKLNWKQTLLNIFKFWTVPTNSKLEDVTRKIYEDGQQPTFASQPSWATSWFVIWKQAYEYNPNLDQKTLYEIDIKTTEETNWSKTKKRYNNGKALRKANNPDGYWTTKVGCEASAYFVVWNAVRFALELQRPEDHLFIMWDKPLSLSLIGITALLGLLGMILTQTVAADFFRQPGYLYEKQYFADRPIDKYWWPKSKNKSEKVVSKDEQFNQKKIKAKKQISVDNKLVAKQQKAAAKLAKLEAKQKIKIN